jgi:DNA-binding response OmpR family regulator
VENPLRYTITLDDDPMVSKYIERVTGLNSLPFSTGTALLKRCNSYDPVAVFVDIHLDAGESGLDIIPMLRRTWAFTPIIVVTSDPLGDLVGNALAAGANDFVKKPIDASELKGRLHARIREMSARQSLDVLNICDVKFSFDKLTVEKNGKIVYLPKLEAELLSILMQSRNMVLTRDEIKRRLWGQVSVSDNTIDKKISGLRKALLHIESEMSVNTLYGKGVMLESTKNRNAKTKESS